MSKKVLLNDLETVTNEDVFNSSELRSRDLNRVLEALSQGTFLAGSGIPTGLIVSGSVLSGLVVTAGSGATVNISAGLGFLCLGGATTGTSNNRFRIFSLEESTTVTLTPTSPTLSTWYVIEVSSLETITTESRQVLSTGPSRTLSPVVVPKYTSSTLQFRMRAGTAGTVTEALLPFLQAPDQAWMPIAAVRVDAPGTTVSHILDLRKMFAFTSPSYSTVVENNGNSFDRPVSLYLDSSNALLFSNKNWVRIGSYRSPIGAVPSSVQTNSPYIDPNVDKPSTLTLQVSTWYYLYAYRPIENCGFTSMFLSDIQPAGTGVPLSTMTLPAPWPANPLPPALYMGAVRLYEISTGVYGIRNFYQSGNYVALGASIVTSLPGANQTSKFVDGSSIAAGTYSVSVLTGVSGDPLIPSHTKMVRTLWSVKALTSDCAFTIYTSSDFTLLSQYIDASTTGYFTIDIPLPFSGTHICKYTVLSVDTAQITASIIGYYEGVQ